MKRLVICLFLLSVIPSVADTQEQDAPTAASFDYRLWTSNAGTSTRAKLIGIKGNEATLAKEDGSVVKVNLDVLSISDRAYCSWITNLVQAKAPTKTESDLPIADHFIVRLETSFRLAQLEIATVAESDLTNAAKFIAWDKAIDLMVAEFIAASKHPELVLATVLEAEESYDSYTVKCQVDDTQNFIDLTIKGRPKELSTLKAGESIQFQASPRPSSKLKLTGILLIPWGQADNNQQFYRQYKQISHMVGNDGLSIPLHVSMFTIQEKSNLP